MTNEKAIKEAEKRWGKHFYIEFLPDTYDIPTYTYPYFVRNVQRTQAGVGKSWEEAFAMADRKLKRKKK